MGMADTHVVDQLRQRCRRNLLYALAPLALLYTLTIAYLALVGQMTTGNLISPLIYLFLPALLLWQDRHSPEYLTWQNLAAILIVWFFIELWLVPDPQVPP